MNKNSIQDMILDDIDKKRVDKREVIVREMKYHLDELSKLISLYKSVAEKPAIKSKLENMDNNQREVKASWWNIKHLL